MSFIHGQVLYQDLVIRHADMVLTHGVTPSVCHILALPGPVPLLPGTLTFMENAGNVIQFHDCAINRTTLERVKSLTGHRMVMQVQDRRWRWKYQHVSGEYNLRKRDATAHEDYEKTYYELLEILLKALGEDDYEIIMPEPDLPGIHVNWQHARADLELAKLLDKIGCIVTLGLDNRIHILTNGEGAEYPFNGREKMPLMQCTPGTLPAKVTVEFQDTRIQAPLKLEAVGLDTDRDIIPINDLEYNPSDVAMWANCAPDWFPEVADEADAQLARRSVYKWYVATGLDEGITTLTIAEGPTLDDSVEAERLFPLEEQLLEHPAEDVSRPSKAYIYGDMWQGDLAGVTAEDATETESFVLDGPRGMVYFDTCVMKVEFDDSPMEPDIAIVCAFRIREDNTHEFHRYRYSVDTGLGVDESSGEAVVVVPDRYLWYQYDMESEEWTDNLSVIKEHAEKLAACYIKSFTNVPQAAQEWVGLVPFPVQGNIHMMRWVSTTTGLPADGCTTFGYKNVESALIAPVHHERRMREIARGLLT